MKWFNNLAKEMQDKLNNNLQQIGEEAGQDVSKLLLKNEVLQHPALAEFKKEQVFTNSNVQNIKDYGNWVRKNGELYFTSTEETGEFLWEDEDIVGKSLIQQEKNGKAHYRIDGSVMFGNQTDAYNYMFRITHDVQKETMCVGLKQYVLVLPYYKNSIDNSTRDKHEGYVLDNGQLRDRVQGEILNVIFTMHTHPGGGGPSLDDLRFFATFTPMKPAYILASMINKTSSLYNKINYIEKIGSLWILQGQLTKDANPSDAYHVPDKKTDITLKELLLNNFDLRNYKW